MTDKLDMIHDLVKDIDNRQRSKDLEDASRHAEENVWRQHVNFKLEEHSQAHKKADKRLDTLEAPSKAWGVLRTKAGRVSVSVTFLTTVVYNIYRMLV